MGSRLDKVTGWDEPARKAGYCVLSLAVQLRVSDRHIRRYFALRFAVSPQQFLDRLRLQDARAALVLGEDIKCVASFYGFKQVSHFSRCFKREFGISPSNVSAVERLPQVEMSAWDNKCPSWITDASSRSAVRPHALDIAK